jgi:hypothetical protein
MRNWNWGLIIIVGCLLVFWGWVATQLIPFVLKINRMF